jgi:hypothetical protein
MRIRLAIAMLLASGLTGCGPSEKEIAIDQSQQRVGSVAAAVRQHFGSEVDAGNWGKWPVTTIETRVSEFEPYPIVVSVEMAVPTDMAKKIMAQPTELQYKSVGWNACPSPRDSVWAALDSKDRIIAQPTISGAVFADVDCRREGL